MVSWIWVPVVFFAGVIFGIGLIAIVSANK